MHFGMLTGLVEVQHLKQCWVEEYPIQCSLCSCGPTSFRETKVEVHRTLVVSVRQVNVKAPTDGQWKKATLNM